MKKGVLTTFLGFFASISVSQASVIFEADFQGAASGASNLLLSSVAGRNIILNNGTSIGSWDDNGATPRYLYEIAEDEAGNKVMVFSHSKSSDSGGLIYQTLADAHFSSTADLTGNNSLTLGWDWMHVDESGGGVGHALFDILDSAGAAIATVKWVDGGALSLDNTLLGNLNRQLHGRTNTVLTSGNWNPLAMEITMTSSGIELLANGVVLTNMAGSYTDAAGIRLRGASNRTWSEGGMWIDNISADLAAIPEPAVVTFIALFGGSLLWIKRRIN
jgi:hypothetical protein